MAALRAQASRRDIVLPTRFDIPDMDHWSRHYRVEARKVRGLTEQTLADGISVVGNFVDPILAATATARGTRSPCAGAAGSEGEMELPSRLSIRLVPAWESTCRNSRSSARANRGNLRTIGDRPLGSVAAVRMNEMAI